MPQYSYTSINDKGKKVSGKMVAENQSELMAILKRMGEDLVDCKVAEGKKSSLSFLNRIKQKDLITTFVHLEQLDRAGISIIDSIQDLKENSDSPKVKSLMGEIYDLIKNGSLLSESLKKYPNIFNPVYVGLILTGEKTGNFTESFTNIVEDLKWNMDMKRKTRKATIGPSFGILLMFLVMAIMTSVVVPKVTAFLLAQDIDLPAVTLSLIAFSNFVKSYWLFIILFIPVTWT
ncbi:MAG: type II secretion system F family protein, partial [Pelagibacterales bacterium]|nr:type II secretion system F family protein [Pelagibacterales bacterium]